MGLHAVSKLMPLSPRRVAGRSRSRVLPNLAGTLSPLRQKSPSPFLKRVNKYDTMPRPASTRSESESERVSSKKQKKREESPADDPMDEDEKDELEEEGEEEEEYEIERILDSSEEIFPGVRCICWPRLQGNYLNFPQKETGYFVKWKGYPESENSWVRESDAPYVPLAATWLGAHDLDLCRNADELISKFLDEKRTREKAKKAAAKRRKSSAEITKQEPKKRGRISIRSKADSDEEELERSPAQPIAKKQKKDKTATSTKKRAEPAPEEPTPGEDDLDPAGFTSMDRWMHLDDWEHLVDKIDTIERDGEGNLFIYGTL